MNPETIDLIRDLADRLGTTVEELWPALCANVVASWWGGFAAATLGLAIGVALLLWLKKNSSDHDEDVLIPVMSVGFLITIISLIALGHYLADLGDMLHPEAEALRNLMRMVR